MIIDCLSKFRITLIFVITLSTLMHGASAAVPQDGCLILETLSDKVLAQLTAKVSQDKNRSNPGRIYVIKGEPARGKTFLLRRYVEHRTANKQNSIWIDNVDYLIQVGATFFGGSGPINTDVILDLPSKDFNLFLPYTIEQIAKWVSMNGGALLMTMDSSLFLVMTSPGTHFYQPSFLSRLDITDLDEKFK